MISLLQRVRQARVEVAGEVIGEIGAGLLALVCAEQGDGELEADRLLAKLLKLRIFADAAGKMNRSLQDMGGGLLVVSQFTLAADTSGGNRPGFSQAAAPAEGERLYDYFVARARAAPRGGNRALCRRHAGAPGQRRAGDDTAAHCARSCKNIAASDCWISAAAYFIA